MTLCSQCGERPAKARYSRCARCRGGEFDLCDCGSQKTKRATACQDCARLRRGSEHGSWKGGRVQLKDGYVRVWAPDHPRAVNGRYVLEHLTVMEESLGRSLLPGENVHHKNGVRNDNRPENLELWITHQPQGQRPADLLAWAHEIIERYEENTSL